MKTTIKNMSSKVFLLFFSMLLGGYAMAQDATSTQTESHASHSESTTPAVDAAMWYANPIVWVVGGAVLLILIILAVRSGGGTTVVRDGGTSKTTTTTVRKD